MITPWLEPFWNHCIQAFKQGRLPHALLISGCAGLGKLAFAQALAQHILCSAKEERACGQCQSCLWFQAGNHPDFSLVRPEEDKKQIGIAQIRDLSEALTRTGYGSHQVVIIHPAEAMNRASANALLKTLEEPNGQVILLLVCDHPASLLPTIRSRCQELRVQQPSTEIALSWLTTELSELAQQSDLAAKAASSTTTSSRPSKKRAVQTPTEMPSPAELLALADGLPLRAFRLAQTGEWQQHNAISADFIRVLSGQMTILKAAELWSKQSPLAVLTILATLVQDMIRLMTGLSTAQIQHRHHAADLQRLVQQCQLHQLWSFMREILLAKRRAMSTANPNVQLLLESVLLSYFSNKQRAKL